MTVAVAKAMTYDEEDVRRALSNLFELLGYEKTNPLGRIVRPGDTVFIKPNWVAHEYRRSCPRQDDVFSTITHPSVIEAVADHVAVALKGEGEIIIGDNPSIDADFDRLLELMDLEALTTRYEVPCRFVDLRPLVCDDLKDYGKRSKMRAQEGDPKGTTIVNLGKRSMLHGVNPLLFRGVFRERFETISHHWGKRQEYGLANSILKSDVYISIPKLKTHHKVGTTLNLKGLVGANTIKNYLVHWRTGWPAMGGDEYPDFGSWFKSKFQKITNRGAWNGNDTIWRMVVDIYKAFDEAGPVRRFSVIDGIMGGQRDGPFCPTSKNSRTLIAGEDLLLVDIVASRLMGFNVVEIPYLRYLVGQKKIDFSEIDVRASDMDLDCFFDNGKRHLAFNPPSSWGNLLNSTNKISHDIGRI